MLKKISGLLVFSTVLLIILTGSVVWAGPKGSVTIAIESFGKEGDWWPQGVGYERLMIGAMSDPLTIQYSPWERDAPAIASAWKISPDGLTFDFTIRDDVYFHDGTKLTSEDVAYTIAPRWIDQFDGFSRIKRGNVKSTEVKGNHFIVHLGKPVPQMLSNYMCRIGIKPKAYMERVGVKGYNKKPIGAGPFKLVKHVKGEYIKMEAVENHYRKSPAYKELIWRLVPEPATRIAMLRTGEADVTFNEMGPNTGELKKFGFNAKPFGSPSHWSIYFGRLVMKERPKSRFDDVRVRRALLYAIDTEKLAKIGFYGVAKPAVPTFMVASALPGFNPAFKPYPYDTEKAQALLAEAGYPNGFTCDLYTSTVDRQRALLVASDLNKVGVKTNLKVYEPTTLTKIRYGRKWEGDPMIFAGSAGYGVAALFCLNWNAMWCYYSSEETHKLHDEGGAIVQPDDQIKWEREVLAPKMYELQPVLPLVELLNGILGLGPKVKSWEKTDNHTFGPEFITLKD